MSILSCCDLILFAYTNLGRDAISQLHLIHLAELE